MQKWTTIDIPSQRGKLAVVTGANSGLGFCVALELAKAGASVILACRDEAKGTNALARIRAQVRPAHVSLERLNLAELESVQAFAEKIVRRGKLDLLVNNAGILAPPKRETTADGFEMQFGVNHLGHFALTGWLLPALLQAERPRVITVSSLAHSFGRMDFSDLQAEHFYFPWAAYAQSKLANLLFAFELQARSDAANSKLLSVAAHPGLSATNIVAAGPGMDGPSLQAIFLMVTSSMLSQPAAQGSLPILYAATAPAVKRGGFYGPAGIGEFWGYPQPARLAPQASERKVAMKLWQISEQLTGVRYSKALRRSRGWMAAALGSAPEQRTGDRRRPSSQPQGSR
jgi:NAD(P)-dependent dehydrogenase (short-subunit alcohol dehydrogenase family)